MKKLILLPLAIYSLFSCTNASEDDLVEATPIPATITYVDHVKVIMDNNCINCHSSPPVNGAPMALTTYQNVFDAVEDRDLIDRINTQDASFLMPLGGPRMPQNLIDIVIEWEDQGLIEN